MLRTSHQTEQAKTDKNVIKTCNVWPPYYYGVFCKLLSKKRYLIGEKKVGKKFIAGENFSRGKI